MSEHHSHADRFAALHALVHRVHFTPSHRVELFPVRLPPGFTYAVLRVLSDISSSTGIQ